MLLASSIALVQAVGAETFGYAPAMALIAAAVFILGAVVVSLGPERRAAVFG